MSLEPQPNAKEDPTDHLLSELTVINREYGAGTVNLQDSLLSTARHITKMIRVGDKEATNTAVRVGLMLDVPSLMRGGYPLKPGFKERYKKIFSELKELSDKTFNNEIEWPELEILDDIKESED